MMTPTPGSRLPKDSGPPERRGDSRSEASRREGGPERDANEVSERPQRRRYSAEYKARILREVEACTIPGQVGAIVRREGLYTSLLVTWRRQRDGLGPRP